MKPKISELNKTQSAKHLIEHHTIGALRNENDLQNAKYHSSITITFLLDVLENIDGTLDEKIEFLKQIKDEIPKFDVKK